MKFSVLQENLERTIAQKKNLLAHYDARLQGTSTDLSNTGALFAMRATREFLEINIQELCRILDDLKLCIAKELPTLHTA